MDEGTLTAMLKSAAYGLSAIVGWQKAVRILKQVATQMESEQWNGSGSR